MPGAAVLLGDRDAEEAELGHLGDDLGRPAPGLVELRGLGGDLAGGEVARRALDEALLFGQLEVHGARNLAGIAG